MTPLSAERRSEIMLGNIAESDCGVVALQGVTGWGRCKAEGALLGKGYHPDTGTGRGALERALRAAGWVCQHVQCSGHTPTTFAYDHDAGLYLLYVDKHVMPLVDGGLHNARGSWRKPLDQVTRVLAPGVTR